MAFALVSAATPSPQDIGDTPLLADIRVELDVPSDSDGPLVFEVIGAPVTDGIELDNPGPLSNPSSWAGSVTVDIASDLSQVVVTGGAAYGSFEEAQVTITLSGGTWPSAVTFTGELFTNVPPTQDPDAGEAEMALDGPRLTVLDVAGASLETLWFGQAEQWMSGSTTFTLREAAPAEPVDGVATFAG